MDMSVMPSAITVFGVALVTVSIFIIVSRITFRDEGVELHEEWEETRITISKSHTNKNIIIADLICFGAGYLITGRLLFAAIAW